MNTRKEKLKFLMDLQRGHARLSELQPKEFEIKIGMKGNDYFINGQKVERSVFEDEVSRVPNLPDEWQVEIV